MRYRLRTLLIVLAVVPPLFAGVWRALVTERATIPEMILGFVVLGGLAAAVA